MYSIDGSDGQYNHKKVKETKKLFKKDQNLFKEF